MTAGRRRSVTDETGKSLQTNRFIGGLVAILAVIFLLHEWTLAESPADSDWEPALSHLNKELLPEDGILISPTWHAYPGKKIGPFLSRAGHDGHLLHADPLTLLDISRYPRIWVLTPQGEVPPLLQTCQSIEGVSPVGLCLWQRDIRAPLVDFIDKLPQAKVHRSGKRKNIIKCDWKKKRHQCKTSKRMYDVRAFVGEVGDTRRHSIFAHPYPSNGKLEILYRKLRRGDTLTVSYGNALRGVRMNQGAPVVFSVFVDDELIHEAQIEIDDFTWNTVELRVPSGDKTCDYRFVVTSDDSSWRHFFFDGAAF